MKTGGLGGWTYHVQGWLAAISGAGRGSRRDLDSNKMVAFVYLTPYGDDASSVTRVHPQ